MMIIEIYIYLLTSIMLLFCVTTNPMYAVFSFIAYATLLFISFFFLRVEFLAYLFLIIYLGAIIVLFLFVIMLIEFRPIYSDSWDKAFRKVTVLYFCLYRFFISVKNLHLNEKVKKATIIKNQELIYDINDFQDNLDIIEIGFIIYDNYIVLFLNITMLFLLGIVSVVLLTKPKQPKNIRLQKFLSENKKKDQKKRRDE